MGVLGACRCVADVSRLLARIIGAVHRSNSQPRSRALWSHANVQRRSVRLLMDFNGLIQSGGFEAQGVRCETRLTLRDVWGPLLEWERADPERYAAQPSDSRPIPERRLSPEDVAGLYAVCRTARETCVLALLAESVGSWVAQALSRSAARRVR